MCVCVCQGRLGRCYSASHDRTTPTCLAFEGVVAPLGGLRKYLTESTAPTQVERARDFEPAHGDRIGLFLNLSPNQGDSDCVSVVSSDCGVNGGGRGNEEIPLCILSPDCELFICDGDDDSTDRFGM